MHEKFLILVKKDIQSLLHICIYIPIVASFHTIFENILRIAIRIP